MWTLVYQPHSSIVWTFSCSNMFQHVPTFKAHSLVTKLFEPTAIKLCKIATYPWPHRIPMKMPTGDVSERRIVSGLTGHDPYSLVPSEGGLKDSSFFRSKRRLNRVLANCGCPMRQKLHRSMKNEDFRKSHDSSIKGETSHDLADNSREPRISCPSPHVPAR